MHNRKRNDTIKKNESSGTKKIEDDKVPPKNKSLLVNI